jgi:S-formylglutathione hydrolase FrmB
MAGANLCLRTKAKITNYMHHKSRLSWLLFFVVFWSCHRVGYIQNQGKVTKSATFMSKSLRKQVKYAIYLPPNYQVDDKNYPVVYLLHGFGGSEKDWVKNGEMARQTDEAIAAGQIPPMIVVMPDGQNSWYINSDRAGDYENMMLHDLIPMVDSLFRTKNKKETRAIVGLSMGGNGAFCLAMKRPDLFSASVVMSGSFWTPSYYEDRKEAVPRLFEGVYGSDPINSPLWDTNNPFSFLKAERVDAYNTVQLMFDCGDDDFVFDSQISLIQHLRQLKIKHELRIRNGAHDWDYWRASLVPALQFCAESFK